MNPARLPVPPPRHLRSDENNASGGTQIENTQCTDKYHEDCRSGVSYPEFPQRAGLYYRIFLCGVPSVNNFLFNLPDERIARYPRKVRSHSRLMVIHPDSHSIVESRFDSLPEFLEPGDLLVLNSSKVIPARLLLRKHTGGKVELLLERVLETDLALVLLKSSKPVVVGTLLLLQNNKDVSCQVIDRQQEFFLVRLSGDNDWLALLNVFGQIPLPPYMRRDDNEEDRERYQTVYAKELGSVAAPTAGLHFDDDVFTRLKQRGVDCAWLQLHVGYGTFVPLRSADVDHLHQERFQIDQQCCDQIIATQQRGGKIIAVGTTTCRVLETLAQRAGDAGKIECCMGETNLFIRPGFRFRCVDAMVTNFHLPESSLLYLVAAFAGSDFIMRSYTEAIDKQYNFYSYGDAMFINCRAYGSC